MSISPILVLGSLLNIFILCLLVVLFLAALKYLRTKA